MVARSATTSVYVPRAASRRRGTAIIELALVMGILMTLAFGMVEFGYFLYVKHLVTQAATAGAMTASLPDSANTDVTNSVAAVLTASGMPSGYTVTTTPTTVFGVTSGSTITVLVSYPWGTAGVGFRPMALIPTTKTVSSSAIMRRQK